MLEPVNTLNKEKVRRAILPYTIRSLPSLAPALHQPRKRRSTRGRSALWAPPLEAVHGRAPYGEPWAKRRTENPQNETA